MKKRSATKREPLEATTYFVDRSLGRRVADLLCAAGIQAIKHDDHFPEGTEDTVWLEEIGKSNWVVLTKDKCIRKRQHEREALIAASVRMFVLTAGKDLRGEEMAQIFIDNISRMERMIRKQPAPFIANVYRSEVRLTYPPPPPSSSE